MKIKKVIAIFNFYIKSVNFAWPYGTYIQHIVTQSYQHKIPQSKNTVFQMEFYFGYKSATVWAEKLLKNIIIRVWKK